MKPELLFLALATVGVVIYQLAQKCVPPAVNPMAMLMAAYSVAMLVCLVALPLMPTTGPGNPWRMAFAGLAQGPGPWVALALGVGVLLIEVGFLLAFRVGGSLQWAGVAVNGTASLLLIPIAITVFREAFSLPKALGILLVLAGLALLSRK
jgi:hypothetical protein